MNSPRTSLFPRILGAGVLVLAAACGGGGAGQGGVEEMRTFQLLYQGSSQANLLPSTSYTLTLQASVQGGDFSDTVEFDYNPAHFEDIEAQAVSIQSGTATYSIAIRTKSLSEAVEGSIGLRLASGARATLGGLTYSIGGSNALLLRNFSVTGGEGDSASDPASLTISLESPPATGRSIAFRIGSIGSPLVDKSLSISSPGASATVAVPGLSASSHPLSRRDVTISMMDGSTIDTRLTHEVVFNPRGGILHRQWSGPISISGEQGLLVVTLERISVAQDAGARHLATGKITRARVQVLNTSTFDLNYTANCSPGDRLQFGGSGGAVLTAIDLEGGRLRVEIESSTFPRQSLSLTGS